MEERRKGSTSAIKGEQPTPISPHQCWRSERTEGRQDGVDIDYSSYVCLSVCLIVGPYLTRAGVLALALVLPRSDPTSWSGESVSTNKLGVRGRHNMKEQEGSGRTKD